MCGAITKGGGSIIRKVMDHTFDNSLKSWGWRLKVSHYSPCEQNTPTRECGDYVTSKPFCSKTHCRVLFTCSGEYMDYIWRTTNQRYFPFLVIHQNRWFTWPGLKANVAFPVHLLGRGTILHAEGKTILISQIIYLEASLSSNWLKGTLPTRIMFKGWRPSEIHIKLEKKGLVDKNKIKRSTFPLTQ